MITADTQFLAISGIQHFSFCRRQWALIHIEKQWADNLRTVEGHIMHSRAHDSSLREKRGSTLILRELTVYSNKLSFSGKCDIVEFHLSPNGVRLQNEDGLWQPYPVEYKRGEPKPDDSDKLQLCLQAMCLEEMLCCKITEGALFYGETRHRLTVDFSEDLRNKVISLCAEMHELAARGYTPKVKTTKNCKACSLNELCLPKLMKRKPPSSYIAEKLAEEET